MPKAPRSFWQSLREIDYVYWALQIAVIVAGPLAVVTRHAWITSLLLLPAWGFAIYRERRKKLLAQRLFLGQCPDCGYDLRATRDRCPECGRVVTEAEQFQFGRNNLIEKPQQEMPTLFWILLALIASVAVLVFLPAGSGKYVLFIALVGLYCYGVWWFIRWFERRGSRRPE